MLLGLRGSDLGEQSCIIRVLAVNDRHQIPKPVRDHAAQLDGPSKAALLYEYAYVVKLDAGHAHLMGEIVRHKGTLPALG